MPEVSRRALLLGGLGIVGVGVAGGLGVKSGIDANRRRVIPPNATPHPGILVVPVTKPTPVVQVFIDPSTPESTAFATVTAAAFKELADQQRIQLVHRLHFGNNPTMEMCNALACADVVGHYWDAYTGNPPTSDEYRRLVTEQACYDFVTDMAIECQRAGVINVEPMVYLNDVLVQELSEKPADYATAEKLSAILRLT